MNDYGLGYDDGYYAGRSQAKVDQAVGKAAGSIAGASGSLLGFLFVALARIVSVLLICSGPLVAGYWTLQRLNVSFSSDGQQIAYTVALGIIIASLVFVFKGLLVGLKQRGNALWMILWTLCFALVVVLPFFALERIVAGLLHSHGGSVLTWAGAAIGGLYIFFKYELTKDSTPRLFKWAYHIGRTLA